MADEEKTGVDLDEQETASVEAEGEADGVETEEQSDDEKLMAKLEEAVEVDVEEIGALRKKLSITIPRTLIDDQMGDQLAELKREATIPGFRRGRAPLRLVEKRFGNDVGEEVGASLLSKGYLAATNKLELNTLGDPLIWAKIPEQISDESGMNKAAVVDRLVKLEEAIDHLHLPKEGDFSFSCEVELKPEFELPELEGIAVEKASQEVSEADVDDEVKRRMAFRGRYAPVEDGPIVEDDLVVGDLAVVVDGDTVKSEANAMLAARDQFYSGMQLTGLGDALVGKKAGDEVELEVTFPEDYETPERRGKTGTFGLQIADVKRLEIPELTEELLSELGYDDETDLRDTMKAALEQRQEGEVKEAMRQQITAHVLKGVDFALPEGLSQRQADAIVRRRMIEMYQAGMPETEISKQLDELRLRAVEQAAEDLKLFFVMDKIATEREISVSEDEMNGAIASIAGMQGKRFDRMRDELIKNDGISALYLRLRDGKILDALLEKAEITEK
ncbi:MAG: trigger factor [bacterium]|nr:trigger factor [bacterium]